MTVSLEMTDTENRGTRYDCYFSLIFNAVSLLFSKKIPLFLSLPSN